MHGTVDAVCARECRRRTPVDTCIYARTSARPKFHNLRLSGNNTGLHVHDCAALGWGAPYGDGVVLQRGRLGRIVAARIQAHRHVRRVHHLQLLPGTGPRRLWCHSLLPWSPPPSEWLPQKSILASRRRRARGGRQGGYRQMSFITNLTTPNANPWADPPVRSDPFAVRPHPRAVAKAGHPS